MLKFAGFPVSAWAFALRTWAAMMLALYVAFWLQLENGYIAAFTVGILSLQTRGQAYQKALYQLLMTVVGVVASIVIAGLLAQARDLFVIAYAIWLGLCVVCCSAQIRAVITKKAGTVGATSCIMILMLGAATYRLQGSLSFPTITGLPACRGKGSLG